MTEPRPVPRYAVAGLLVMALSMVGMLLQFEPFWTWHTPIAWTGYILFADGLVWSRRGHSWLTTARGEFLFLAVVSVPLWLIFEGYNLFIRNWHYVNLPEPLLLGLLGYGWSFATIWPAIFVTGELVATMRQPAGASAPRDAASLACGARPGARAWVAVAAGAAMLAWPLIWPSPYLAAPVWLGFILLLDPLNAWLGGEALLCDLRRGSRDRLLNLAASGVVCGFVWELWNYWARAKWIYTVPILPDLKLFEMPAAGYLGFPAFALECFTMYVAVRLLIWRGPGRPISL